MSTVTKPRWYSELNSIQSEYLGFFTLCKLTEWCRFVAYLRDVVTVLVVVIVLVVIIAVIVIVPQLYTVISTDTYEQFLQVYYAGLGLDVSFWVSCVFYLAKASLFIFLCFGCIFSCLLCVVSKVPVIAWNWKDSSLKWPIMCQLGRKTLLTHSVIPYNINW